MALMPEDVLSKNFTATQFRRGYDEHEVDDFLDEIVVELRSLSSDSEDLRGQLKVCRESLKVCEERLKTCQEDKGVISPDAQDKIGAARASAELAEQDAAARIAKANADAELAEAQAAERAKAALEAMEAVPETALSLIAADDAPPAIAEDAEPATQAEPVTADGPGVSVAGVDGSAGLGSAAGVLALAQKLHEQYVTEGESTRERLISEGQSQHDQVVGEATARQQELLSTGQAKHDELIAEATSRHKEMLDEARERSTVMVAEAQQKKAEVLQTLGRERDLLQKKIDELRIFERDYRARLKAHLESQLLELVQAGDEQITDGDDDVSRQPGKPHDG